MNNQNHSKVSFKCAEFTSHSLANFFEMQAEEEPPAIHRVLPVAKDSAAVDRRG